MVRRTAGDEAQDTVGRDRLACWRCFSCDCLGGSSWRGPIPLSLYLLEHRAKVLVSLAGGINEEIQKASQQAARMEDPDSIARRRLAKGRIAADPLLEENLLQLASQLRLDPRALALGRIAKHLGDVHPI